MASESGLCATCMQHWGNEQTIASLQTALAAANERIAASHRNVELAHERAIVAEGGLAAANVRADKAEERWREFSAEVAGWEMQCKGLTEELQQANARAEAAELRERKAWAALVPYQERCRKAEAELLAQRQVTDNWQAEAVRREEATQAQRERAEAAEKALRQVEAAYTDDEYEPVRIVRQYVEPALRQSQPASEREA